MKTWQKTWWSRFVKQSPRNTKHDLRRPMHLESLESREMFAVTYHGGALLTSVEAQAVYLGSDWSTNASLKSQETALDTYLADIVQSPYMDMLSNAGYGVGRGTATAGVVNDVTLNKSTSLSDTSIQNYLKTMISAGKVAPVDANRLYVVYVEPGVVVSMGGSTSQNSFLGYHGAFSANGKDVRYVVLPYPGSPNPTPGSQGIANVMDELTMVTSHELAEAVTDPDVNYKTTGWYDDQLDGEIGDLTSRTTRMDGYLVQAVVNKNDQVIYPTTTNPPTTGTLAAPLNVAATALTATSVRLTWSSSVGATGYRIYQIEGATKTLLGSVASSATSATVSNLKAGSTVSLLVQAFNATASADSAVVSVTLPTGSTSIAAPVLTALPVTSTSALLAWNAISGAEGYRIFYWDGTKSVLIGTVGKSATSVMVTGLARGSSTKLMVEAFSGAIYADSNWVTVTTRRR